MQAKEAMFQSSRPREARGIVWVKRACLIVVSVYLLLGMIATYRALVQVRSLEMQAAETLHPGSVITTTVVSYGRVPVDVRVELIQDAHSETLAVQRVPKNEWSLLDPRSRQWSQTTVVSADVLNRFAEGKAIVRTTVIRREQLGRLPPPIVREQVVNIQPTSQ